MCPSPGVLPQKLFYSLKATDTTIKKKLQRELKFGRIVVSLALSKMAEIADREAKEVRLGLIFDKMDDDGDGKLSKDELAKYLGAENAD